MNIPSFEFKDNVCEINYWGNGEGYIRFIGEGDIRFSFRDEKAMRDFINFVECYKLGKALKDLNSIIKFEMKGMKDL